MDPATSWTRRRRPAAGVVSWAADHARHPLGRSGPIDLVNLFVGLAILVGLAGIVLPVLPGSLIIAVAVLVWAIDAESGWAWVVLGVVVVLLAAGWAATYVLTGTRVAAAGVPRSSMVVAGLAGIVGFFVVPVIGLFLFFAGGLYVAEARRLRDTQAARRSATLAIKATLKGMLVELLLALLAASTWAVAALGVGVGSR